MMSSLSTENRRAQAGFTLVELAIVLVIVGLLIGGILKGQELIASTRITSTAAQMKAIEAAITSFTDTFGAKPGDIQTVASRLPNCATANSVCLGANAAPGGGNGDGVIANTFGTATAIGQEGNMVFAHLAAADLISGVLPTSTALTIVGKGVLSAPLGGASTYRVGETLTSVALLGSGVNQAKGGYLLLANNLGGIANAAAFEGNGIQPKAAQKIDAKMDDGSPNTGVVYAVGTGAAASNTVGCSSSSTVLTATYNSQNIENDCGLYVQIIR